MVGIKRRVAGVVDITFLERGHLSSSRLFPFVVPLLGSVFYDWDGNG